jgi:hypothetical protein
LCPRERLSPTEIEITPAMLSAGKAIYREWEESVDFNGGYGANPLNVEDLVSRLLVLHKSVRVVR